MCASAYFARVWRANWRRFRCIPSEFARPEVRFCSLGGPKDVLDGQGRASSRAVVESSSAFGRQKLSRGHVVTLVTSHRPSGIPGALCTLHYLVVRHLSARVFDRSGFSPSSSPPREVCSGVVIGSNIPPAYLPLLSEAPFRGGCLRRFLSWLAVRPSFQFCYRGSIFLYIL